MKTTGDNISAEKEFSPKEIREMLGMDNNQIQDLCKRAEVKLKKNERGFTYFTSNDADVLKNYSEKKNLVIPSGAPSEKSSDMSIYNLETPVENFALVMKNFESEISGRITALLDEKLDGMDEVVMELIRAKTENESLRYKINELNKENFQLKKELNSFKKIPFGFYTKSSEEMQ